MFCCPWVLVAMETHFHVFTLKYQYFENTQLQTNGQIDTRSVQSFTRRHGFFFVASSTASKKKGTLIVDPSSAASFIVVHYVVLSSSYYNQKNFYFNQTTNY